MAITAEQNERLTLILESLEPVLKDLYPNGRTFVEDQIRRHQQYGEDIRLSPKQWKWLEDLYKEFAPNAEVAEAPEAPEAPEQDDMNDEVPF